MIRFPATLALIALSMLFPAAAAAAPMLTVDHEIHAFDADGDDIAWISMDNRNRMAVWTQVAGGTPIKIHSARSKTNIAEVQMFGGRVVFTQNLFTRSGRETSGIYELPVAGGALKVLAEGTFHHSDNCGRAVALLGVGGDGSIYWEDASRNGTTCLSLGDLQTVQRTAADGSVSELRRIESAAKGDFFEKRSFSGSVTEDRILLGGLTHLTVIDRNSAAQLYTTAAAGKSFFNNADISEGGQLVHGKVSGSRRSATGSATLITDLAANIRRSIGKLTVRKALFAALNPNFCGERILRLDQIAKKRSFQTRLVLFEAGGVSPRVIRNTGRNLAFSTTDCDADSLYVAEQSTRSSRTTVTRLATAPG